jgi:hypothetical protein
MDRYTDMAARTVTARARNAAREMEFLAHGQNLVRISSHLPTCPLCAPWNGAILSLAGGEGEAENFGVERLTLADAEAAGLFHPNCLHSFTLFLPGFSDYTPAEYQENGGEPVDQRDLLDMSHVRNVRYKLENFIFNTDPASHGATHGRHFHKDLGFTRDSVAELRQKILLGLQGEQRGAKKTLIKIEPKREAAKRIDSYDVYIKMKGSNGEKRWVFTNWVLGQGEKEKDKALKNFRLVTLYPKDPPAAYLLD